MKRVHRCLLNKINFIKLCKDLKIEPNTELPAKSKVDVLEKVKIISSLRILQAIIFGCKCFYCYAFLKSMLIIRCELFKVVLFDMLIIFH